MEQRKYACIATAWERMTRIRTLVCVCVCVSQQTHTHTRSCVRVCVISEQSHNWCFHIMIINASNGFHRYGCIMVALSAHYGRVIVSRRYCRPVQYRSESPDISRHEYGKRSMITTWWHTHTHAHSHAHAHLHAHPDAHLHTNFTFPGALKTSQFSPLMLTFANVFWKILMQKSLSFFLVTHNIGTTLALHWLYIFIKYLRCRYNTLLIHVYIEGYKIRWELHCVYTVQIPALLLD